MFQLHGFMHLIPNYFFKVLPAWRPKASSLYWSSCVEIHLKPELWHVLFEVFELNIALVWVLSTSEGKETLSYSAHRQPVLEGCCLSSVSRLQQLTMCNPCVTAHKENQCHCKSMKCWINTFYMSRCLYFIL